MPRSSEKQNSFQQMLEKGIKLTVAAQLFYALILIGAGLLAFGIIARAIYNVRVLAYVGVCGGASVVILGTILLAVLWRRKGLVK